MDARTSSRRACHASAVIPDPVVPRVRPRTARAARRLRVGLALVLVAGVAGACSTTIEGEPVAGSMPGVLVPPSSEDAGLRVEYERTPREVNEYWTSERQTDALPFDPITPDEGGGAGIADQATGVVVDPTTGPVHPDGAQVPATDAGDPFAATGLAAGTQGRLYMSFPDGDYVCSGTVVNSAGGNVVATAAHCIWDMGADAVADYIVFIPADANDGTVAPHGMWYASGIILPDAFAEGAEETAEGHITGDGWAYDFAFLTMAPNDQGQQIQEVVGGQGIAFGIPAEELVVVGYPSAPPFDGTSQRYCTADEWTPWDYAYSLPCGMTPGSSGGGWLTNYDPVAGAGYLVATTSFGDGWFLGAAPLGATALNLFTEIGGMG